MDGYSAAVALHIALEIQKINISDIAHDLKMPKESVRRKILELEKKGIIKKTGKKTRLIYHDFISCSKKKPC